jgi:hypothetical protein
VRFDPSQTPASGASGILEFPAVAGDDADPAEAPMAQAATIRLVINPLFPALRTGPTAVSGAARRKQIHSSKLDI